jgi:hypothetical protein
MNFRKILELPIMGIVICILVAINMQLISLISRRHSREPQRTYSSSCVILIAVYMILWVLTNMQ